VTSPHAGGRPRIDPSGERVDRRNVSLYRRHWLLLEAYRLGHGLTTRSEALRMLLEEHAERP